MKKIILLLVFIVSLTSGCTQTNNTVMKPMDLSTILYVITVEVILDQQLV